MIGSAGRPMGRWLPLGVAAAIFFHPPTAAAAPSPSSLYRAAQRSYQSLMASPAKKKYRDNYLKVVDRFEKVVKKSPKGPDAPKALFSVGMLYGDMYTHSLLKDDLTKALDAYRRLVARYPSSSLADDAQFEIGEIYRTKLGDNRSAYQAYSLVLKRFPRGDKVRNARYWVKALDAFKPHPAEAKPSPKAAPVRAVEVRKIDFWTNPDSTRISIETSGEASYSWQLLNADPEKDKRPRIYVDISRASLPKSLQAPIPVKDGLLTRVRASQFNERTVRVVLDIDSIDDYQVFNFTDPFRVIVDVKGEPRIPAEVMKDDGGEGETGTTAQEGEKPETPPPPQEAAKTPEEPEEPPAAPDARDLSLYQQLGLGVKKVVIDAGHGGEDSGAVARDGTEEKDLTLQIARRLEEKVKKELGLETVMTRSGDSFIPLEGRTGISMREKGDLFVSIHINSSRNPRARGVSTYILHPPSDMDARSVAARENATSTKNLSELEILYPKIIRPENFKESRKLARDVQRSLIAALRGSYPKIKDIGVKEGPFYVLMNSHTPGILVEVSFISNPTEESRLKDGAYQDAVAEAIAKGIKRYVRDVKMAAL